MSSTPVTPTSSMGSPSNSALPALKTVALQPKLRSQSISMDTALLQIDRLEIGKVFNQDDREKDPLYVINLFFAPSRGHISTNAHSKSKEPAHKSQMGDRDVPDVQVTRKLSELAALRDKIHLCVRPSPREDPSKFCSELTQFLSYSSVRPAAFQHALKVSSGNASPLLMEFLQRTLECCQELLKSNRRASCRGERHVLILIYLFLHPTQP